MYVLLNAACDAVSDIGRDGRFGSKLGQIRSKWDKTGTFSDQISVHLARSSQMYWNLIWKSPGFVPFEINLTHFGAKPQICDTHQELYVFAKYISEQKLYLV